MRLARPSCTLTPSTMDTTTAESPESPPRYAGLRRVLKWIGRVVLLVIFLIALIIGFATSQSDMAKLTHFTESVAGWQQNTEFRQVAMQYVTRGSDAMGTSPMGLTSA